MSHKNNDKQGRFRSKVIAFRVSPEENRVLERKVFLSGLTKQDYLIHCMENQDYVVLGNPYVYRSLKRELIHFIQIEFSRVGALTNITPREIIRDFIELLNTLYQYPEKDLLTIIQSDEFQNHSQPFADQDVSDEFASFEL